MRVIGITVLLAGIFFTLFTFFFEPEISTPTSGWETLIGILVIAVGGVTIFQARKE
jgi:uncharacterized membrane protein HdeD (DUF308 family)